MADLYLIQTRPAKVLERLIQLRDALPAELESRMDEINFEEDQALPKQVARLRGATAEDEAVIVSALNAASITSFRVSSNPLLVVSKPEPDVEMDAETMVALMYPDLAQQRGATPGEELWERILNAKASGEPFPQELYDQRKSKAYDEIIKQFDGRVPHEDGGRTLKVRDISGLKYPGRRKVGKQTWEAVCDDLFELLNAFEICREWFGDGGHLRNGLRDQMFKEISFFEDLNARYGLCDGDPNAKLAMDLVVSTMTMLIGTTYPTAAFFFSTTVKIATHNLQGSNVITAKISEMRRELDDTQELAIQTVEQALIALVADWGNLREFVAQEQSGGIAWDDDGAAMRRANAIGYHLACLKSLMELKSAQETKETTWKSTTWGILHHTQLKAKKGAKRKYSDKSGVLTTKARTQKGCVEHYYCDEWFFGRHEVARSQGSGPHVPKITPARTSLANKFFLSGSPGDPGLGISDTFFDNPKVRKAWKLNTAKYFMG